MFRRCVCWIAPTLVCSKLTFTWSRFDLQRFQQFVSMQSILLLSAAVFLKTDPSFKSSNTGPGDSNDEPLSPEAA